MVRITPLSLINTPLPEMGLSKPPPGETQIIFTDAALEIMLISSQSGSIVGGEITLVVIPTTAGFEISVGFLGVSFSIIGVTGVATGLGSLLALESEDSSEDVVIVITGIGVVLAGSAPVSVCGRLPTRTVSWVFFLYVNIVMAVIATITNTAIFT